MLGAHSCLGACHCQTFTFTTLVANTPLRHLRPLTTTSHIIRPVVIPTHTSSATMADVEMTDAPPKTKTSKVDTAADSGKKRFEVKKVHMHAI